MLLVVEYQHGTMHEGGRCNRWRAPSWWKGYNACCL